MASKQSLAFLLFITLLAYSGCSRNPQVKDPLTPEGAEFAQQAHQLMTETESLLEKVPEPLVATVTPFADACRKFSNASHRYGVESLKARDAFDKVFYHASRISIDSTQYPDAAKQWEMIRKDHVNVIARKLGYRID